MNGKSHKFLDSLIFSSLFTMGLIGVAVFVFQYLKFPVWVAAYLGIMIIALFLLRMRKLFFIPNSYLGKILFFFCVYLFIRSFFMPVTGWDSYSLYDSRSRMFMQNSSYSDFATLTRYDIANGFYYFSYPPMTSNLHYWMYLLGLSSPMPVYSLFYIAYISIVVYWTTRYDFPRSLQILSIVSCIFHPLIFRHINTGYTNLPMLSFQMAAVHYLLRFSVEHKNTLVVPFSLMLMFSVWTRVTEPTFVAFILAWSIVAIKKNTDVVSKILLTALPLGAVLICRNVWTGYANQFIRQFVTTSSTLDVKLDSALLDALQIGNILNVFQHLWFSLFPIGLFVIMPLVTTLLLGMRNSLKSLVLSPLFLIWITILIIEFAGTIYVSANYVWWNRIPDSLLRTSLILIPVSVLHFVVSYPIRRKT